MPSCLKDAAFNGGWFFLDSQAHNGGCSDRQTNGKILWKCDVYDYANCREMKKRFQFSFPIRLLLDERTMNVLLTTEGKWQKMFSAGM